MEMRRGFSQEGLKCPYCYEMLPSHRGLRIHVGAEHREKTDEFMEEYFGGRWIEADFVTLMLQNAMGDLTEEFCEPCRKCTTGCSIPRAHEGFQPYTAALKVKSGEAKDLLKSDVMWACASCLACEEQCPAEMSPYEVVSVLENLSARIGYHFPRGYRNMDRNVERMGVIQRPQVILTRTGERVRRGDLGLPRVQTPLDMEKFAEALKKLSGMRVVL